VTLLVVNALVFFYLLKLVASRGRRGQVQPELPGAE